jgi:RNA polymerase sigma-70 factor (ECF subfamily)
MPHPEEAAYLLRAKNGDTEAFAALVRLYQTAIYNRMLRMSASPEDAEDLTQTAFVKAWLSLAQFQGDSSFFTWLYRLANNTALDFLRKSARRGPLRSYSLDDDTRPFSELPAREGSAEDALLRRDLREALTKALDALSPEHRAILLQREIDGLSYQEIAALTGLELGTVKSRIARARLQMRDILTRTGNYFEPSSSKLDK